MLKVGLTGGIGSGKSTVSSLLAELGATVVDADRLAREVVEPGTPGLAAVVAAFGKQVLGPDGGLDREALGRIVFQDDARRRELEGIIHPLVAARAQEMFDAAGPRDVVVHDVPLLVEKQMAGNYDLVIVVGTSEPVRLDRLMQRRGMTRQDALARIRSQADDAARRAVADIWIDNDGDVEEVRRRVAQLWQEELLPRVQR